MSSFPSLFDCEARADAWINGDIPGRADIRRGNAIGSMTVSAGSASTHQDPVDSSRGPTSNVPSSPMGRWVLPNRVTRLGIGLGPFRPFLDTTTLTAQQWLICAALAASILVVSECAAPLIRCISRPMLARTGAATLVQMRSALQQRLWSPSSRHGPSHHLSI